MRDGLLADVTSPLRFSGEPQRPAETGQCADVSVVVGVESARFQCGGQQVGRLGIGQSGSPVGVLVAHGRLQPDERIVDGPEAFVHRASAGEVAGADVVGGRAEDQSGPVCDRQFG